MAGSIVTPTFFQRVALNGGSGHSAFLEGLSGLVRKRLRSPDFTFPDDKHAPAKFRQLVSHTLVAGHVLAEFADPVVTIGLWRPRAASAIVAMPKTTVNKDDRTPARQNNIRLSRQPASAKPKAQSPAMKHFSDFQ